MMIPKGLPVNMVISEGHTLTAFPNETYANEVFALDRYAAAFAIKKNKKEGKAPTHTF